jgi:hypothetical protein
LLATVAASGLAARGVREEPNGRAEPQGSARFEEISAVSADACPCRGGAAGAGDESAAHERAADERAADESAQGDAGAADHDPAADAAAADYRVLAAGANAAVQQELVARADTAAGLAALWDRIARTRVPRPDPPEVDFQTEVVVAVFIGERPSGGYSVEIDGLCRRPGDAARAGAPPGETGGGSPLHLCYTELEPPDDAMVTMALTSPYVLIAVERPVGQVVIHRRTATR